MGPINYLPNRAIQEWAVVGDCALVAACSANIQAGVKGCKSHRDRKIQAVNAGIRFRQGRDPQGDLPHPQDLEDHHVGDGGVDPYCDADVGGDDFQLLQKKFGFI